MNTHIDLYTRLQRQPRHTHQPRRRFFAYSHILHSIQRSEMVAIQRRMGQCVCGYTDESEDVGWHYDDCKLRLCAGCGVVCMARTAVAMGDEKIRWVSW